MLTDDILLDDGVPCIEVDLKWQNNSVWSVFLGLMMFLNSSISLEILLLLLVWNSCFSENICKITFMDSYLLLLYTYFQNSMNSVDFKSRYLDFGYLE